MTGWINPEYEAAADLIRIKAGMQETLISLLDKIGGRVSLRRAFAPRAGLPRRLPTSKVLAQTLLIRAARRRSIAQMQVDRVAADRLKERRLARIFLDRGVSR